MQNIFQEITGTVAGFVTAVAHIPWIFTLPLAGITLESTSCTYVWLMIPPAYLIAILMLFILLEPPAQK